MKVFLVVGMHRSATSLVARGLHLAGVHMGDDLLPPSPTNPEGYYEDRELVEINDKILAEVGGSWDRPPPLDHIVQADPSEIAPYVQHRSSRELWGLKDPRLCLTWPLWLPHLPDDVHVLWIHRDREKVARSLWLRNGFSLDQGRELADVYDDRALRLLSATVHLRR